MRRKVENLFTGEFLKSVSRRLNIMKPQKLPISILFEILEGDTTGKIIKKVLRSQI